MNKDGTQEYVTREYKETPLNLRNGECVFTPSYYILSLKIAEKTVCDTFRHGKPDPQPACSDEINQIRNRKRGREKGSFSYVEFFNIINNKHLFEGAGEPRQFDNSFTHSCKMLAPNNYKPWSERA